MDKGLNHLYGKIYFGEYFDKLIFNYILEHPNITARKLADIRMIRKKRKYASITEGKISSQRVAQMYIYVFNKEVKKI